MEIGLLRDRDFRLLFTADTISQVGTQVTLLALPLVAVLTLDATALEVGILAACETAAFLLVGLPAGALVDRLRRRGTMVVADVLRAVLLASVPLAWWTGTLQMPQLYVVGLLCGVCTVFFDVAYQSYLPFLVGKDRLVEGNARLEMVRSTSQIGGPTVAGGLVKLLGGPLAIATDAASYLVSALFLWRIRKTEERPARRPDAHLGREIMEGLRFVLGNRLLRAISMCTGTGNFFGAIFNAMLIVYLARDLALSPALIGLYFSVTGLGALAGAFLVTPFVRWFGQGPAMWIAMTVASLGNLLVPFARADWRLWLAASGGILFGIGVVVYNVTQVSFRQTITPDELLGRMNATMRFIVWGTMPLGGLAGGLLGAAIGVHPTIWVACAGMLISVVPLLLSPLRKLRELTSAPSAGTEVVRK
ncbi:MFS transporter [Dactylosporangium aurantiacum]|uniref:MFS transporter n=1 Tax=Dactylosporangium aurantiacum TaxID=35754 RepID=A0A9Q9IJQ2_9ACTN|nr:MFS transporter [Dactylosporangium aurantiacum]MDG6100774.1 MFS transporter [Dactylosporangium aurantiacum]UWZ55162.1 MFS transporter [Dactylosporangium aurantiacum]